MSCCFWTIKRLFCCTIATDIVPKTRIFLKRTVSVLLCLLKMFPVFFLGLQIILVCDHCHQFWCFLTVQQNETRGTFLTVLFVSCGFIEGANLLHCTFGRTRPEETAPPGQGRPSASSPSRCVVRSDRFSNLTSSGEDLSAPLVLIHLHNTRKTDVCFSVGA